MGAPQEDGRRQRWRRMRKKHSAHRSHRSHRPHRPHRSGSGDGLAAYYTTGWKGARSIVTKAWLEAVFTRFFLSGCERSRRQGPDPAPLAADRARPPGHGVTHDAWPPGEQRTFRTAARGGERTCPWVRSGAGWGEVALAQEDFDAWGSLARGEQAFETGDHVVRGHRLAEPS